MEHGYQQNSGPAMLKTPLTYIYIYIYMYSFLAILARVESLRHVMSSVGEKMTEDVTFSRHGMGMVYTPEVLQLALEEHKNGWEMIYFPFWVWEGNFSGAMLMKLQVGIAAVIFIDLKHRIVDDLDWFGILRCFLKIWEPLHGFLFLHICYWEQ